MPSSDDTDWIGYCRAFLLTLGLLAIALLCVVWYREGDQSSEWPTLSWVVFWGLGSFGVVNLGIGFFAPSRFVETWADAAFRHEASISVMIIAAPVYFLLRSITRQK